MSTTSKETWQKLAQTWVGIAPKEEHFVSWMSLNLNPPLEGHIPAKWLSQVESDPRAATFVRRYLRSRFKWESTWVDWMPSNEVAALVLEPKESIERAVMLAGAVCCRELIAVSISKAVRIAITQALGAEVLQRLALRPAMRKIALPRAVVPSAWSFMPSETLRRSGLLCLRLAVSAFPSGLESRLATMLPDAVWLEALPEFSPEDAASAMECMIAARKLDQSL